MAQSQLFTPDAAGKRTPTTDRLQVQLSENERISASSDEDMSEYPSPIRGNKENHTPFRGNKNTPNQGNELRPQEGQYESHSDREWRNERVKERINNYRNESRKRKHETSDSESSSDSSNETETESEQSCTDSDMFNPSEVLKNKGGERIPKKISKYIEKYANSGISKNTRQEITKNCKTPNTKLLKSKETDRFVKKLFRKKFNQPMSNKKEKIIINTQNRILDATGPLAILWQEAEKVKKANKGIDPNDVIGIVQRALVLIGNAHYVYMTDRRKTLLSKLVPECVDLIEDSSGKRALKKSKDKLFGNKFRKLLAKDSKDNRELSDLLPSNRKGYKMGKFGDKKDSFRNGGNRPQQFFRQGPSNNRYQFGGQNYRGQLSQRGRGMSKTPFQRKTENQ